MQVSGFAMTCQIYKYTVHSPCWPPNCTLHYCINDANAVHWNSAQILACFIATCIVWRAVRALREGPGDAELMKANIVPLEYNDGKMLYKDTE